MNVSGSYNRWWIIFAIVVIAVPLLSFFGLGGWTTGEEFSPDDFSRRRFAYNEMPLFKITLRGIRYEDITPVFEQSLQVDKLITDNSTIKQWDLVSDSWTALRSPDVDAGLLTGVLDIQDNNYESIWTIWNEDHSELAADLWPIIASLARLRLYIDASEILIKAIDLDKSGRDEFRQFAFDRSVSALNDLAAQRATDGAHEEAESIYSKSIEIAPGKAALQGRAAIYKELGQDEKSDRDIQAAAELDQ